MCVGTPRTREAETSHTGEVPAQRVYMSWMWQTELRLRSGALGASGDHYRRVRADA